MNRRPASALLRSLPSCVLPSARTVAALALVASAVSAQVVQVDDEHEPLRPVRHCQPLFTTLDDLPRATVCVDYSTAFAAVGGGGGPYTYAVTSGALPAGLTLATNGVLSGTPSDDGAARFTVTVTGASGCSNDATFVLPVSLGQRASDAQVGSRIPPAGTGGSGVLADDVTSSTITVSNVSALVAVTRVDVRVTLLHTRDSDLTLTLVAPDATRIPLAAHRGGSGSHYLGTHFRDDADDPICSASAPFAASYRAEQPIGLLQANGTWKLEIEDSVSRRVGRLLDWSLDFETASTPVAIPSGGMQWNVGLSAAPSVVQGIAVDDAAVFVSAGTRTQRIQKEDPASASNWTRDFAIEQPQRPLALQRSFGSECVVVGSSSGFVYALDVTNGTTIWSRSTRRPTCSSDTISCPVVVQIWERSNCAFQTAISNDDLVFVGTHFECGTTTANRVYALNASSGSIRWTHNVTGTFALDAFNGLALDYGRNLLYAVTARQNPVGTQNSVLALDTTNGVRVWGRDLGAIDVEPIVARDGAYVVTHSATVYKLDPDSGATRWSFAIPEVGASVTAPLAYDATRDVLLVQTTSGRAYAIHDDGASASGLWSTNLSGALSVRGAVAPFRGHAYLGSTLSRTYQVDLDTGASATFATNFLDGSSSPASHLLVDASAGSGLAEARLLAIHGSRLERIIVPWIANASDHGALFGPETSVAPGADVSLQGSTSPPAPLVGQNVVDALSAGDFGNRAPECVVVTLTIPANMSFVGASVPQGTVSVVGNLLTIRLGRIQISQTIPVSVTLQATGAGPYSRTYAVSSEIADPSLANNSLVLTN